MLSARNCARLCPLLFYDIASRKPQTTSPNAGFHPQFARVARRPASAGLAYLAVLSGLSALSFGEGFHHLHHAHPNSAKTSAEWCEPDLGWHLAASLRAVGLVWDVQVVGHDHTQRARTKKHRFRWR